MSTHQSHHQAAHRPALSTPSAPADGLYTYAGVGHSTLADSWQAGRAAVEAALVPLHGRPPSLIITYFTNDHDPGQLLDGVRSLAQGATTVGACSATVFAPSVILHHGVVTLVLASNQIQTTAGAISHFTQDPMDVGRELMRQLWRPVNPATAPPNGLALMLESTHDSEAMVNVVEAVGNEIGPLLPVVGGRAVDETHRLENSLFLNDNVYGDAVASVLFLTPGAVGVGVRHGYQPIGRPLVVTRVEGNVLYELDGKSAFEAYREQLPAHLNLTLENYVRHAVNHPIGLPQMGREYIIRDPFASAPDGALLCAGALPKHSVVRIMQGDRTSLLESARLAAADALAALGGKPPLAAFIFSCVTRVAYLGNAIAEELAIIRGIIGQETPLIGIASYGEIAAQPFSPPAFHNKAIVIGLIGAP